MHWEELTVFYKKESTNAYVVVGELVVDVEDVAKEHQVVEEQHLLLPLFPHRTIPNELCTIIRKET